MWAHADRYSPVVIGEILLADQRTAWGKDQAADDLDYSRCLGQVAMLHRSQQLILWGTIYYSPPTPVSFTRDACCKYAGKIIWKHQHRYPYPSETPQHQRTL